MSFFSFCVIVSEGRCRRALPCRKGKSGPWSRIRPAATNGPYFHQQPPPNVRASRRDNAPPRRRDLGSIPFVDDAVEEYDGHLRDETLMEEYILINNEPAIRP